MTPPATPPSVPGAPAPPPAAPGADVIEVGPHASGVYDPPQRPPGLWRRVLQRHADRKGARWGLFAAIALTGVGAFFALRYDEGTPTPLAPAVRVDSASVGPAPSAPSGIVPSFDPSASPEASFRVRTARVASGYRTVAVFANPGEAVPLSAEGRAGRFVLNASAGAVRPAGPNHWRWTAPARPGLHRLTMRDAASGETVRINAIVRTPFDPASEAIGGFRVGPYGRTPHRRNPVYRTPRGLVALTPGMADIAVSPHLTLGQFMPKQPGAPTRYMLLDERLIVKLERLLDRARKAGLPARRLVVMSGYRTPWYNATIGNETTFSAHLYGAAADVYVDDDGDGTMDDLNGDGRVTLDDARALHAVAEGLDADPDVRGGLGLYPANAVHGPFIHLDVRGERARW